MSANQRIPVIVGVGQAMEPVPDKIEAAASAQELAGRAARAALEDALDVEALAPAIDVIVATRTFPDSTPRWPNSFGRSTNMPRSIGARIGAAPRHAVYAKVGGNSPQSLVNEFSEKLADGAAEMVLLAGAEAIANTKAAIKANAELNWAEEVEGQLEDRGPGLKGMISLAEMQHQVIGAPPAYALLETALRAARGETPEKYAKAAGKLFAPLSKVAAANPYAMFPKALSAKDIATPSEANPYIAWPLTKAMVAKDRVNQAAAVLLTTTGKARELGVPEDKWVYLHGYAEAAEPCIMERQDLVAAPAVKLAYGRALECAGRSVDEISFFDIYSCFPVAVFAVCDALGIAPDDPRGLSLTGGLPYFGGPGNNYSMHAIAEMVAKLREAPEAYGLVGANGGMLTKEAVGVYSCKPKEGGWTPCRSDGIQEEIDGLPRPEIDHSPRGPATIETYTVVCQRGAPAAAIVIGRLKRSGARFIANNFGKDRALLERMMAEDWVGRDIYTVSTGRGNRFAAERETALGYLPKPATAFREAYECCLAERRGHVLEVTINRPEVLNCLTPDHNAELAEVFDVYLADDDLWVAIITGAGDKAFSAGNDLKYTASGGAMWVPKAGFGGLTARRNRTKPVIAAVNGFAMGGGLEIALACDLIVASKNARMALPEVKVGLIAGAGGIQRLTRQLPLKQAMKMLLTGEQVGADEALAMGLINEVVPEGQAMEAARKLAEAIIVNSPVSIRCTMDLLNKSMQYASIEDAVNDRYAAMDDLMMSEDVVEGPKAFAEKRKPNWKGR